MSVMMVATTTLNAGQDDALQQYIIATAPMIEKAGGRLVSRLHHNEDIVGAGPSQFVVLVDYPSKAAVRSVFESAEYKALISVRDLAFSTYNISVYSPLD